MNGEAFRLSLKVVNIKLLLMFRLYYIGNIWISYKNFKLLLMSMFKVPITMCKQLRENPF